MNGFLPPITIAVVLCDVYAVIRQRVRALIERFDELGYIPQMCKQHCDVFYTISRVFSSTACDMCVCYAVIFKKNGNATLRKRKQFCSEGNYQKLTTKDQ